LSLCLINQALCHEGIWGSGGTAPTLLTSALDGGEWSASPLGKEPLVTQSIGGWVGPRAGLDAVEKRKILPLSGIEPGVIIPKPTRYVFIVHKITVQ
jgi:hypothetical protein